MTLPLVEVDGDTFDQGRQHGLALRDRIAHNLEVYYDRLLREAKLDRAAVRSRADRYTPVLRSNSAYFASIRGIAEASRIDLLDIVVLNVRYELLYYQYGILPVGGPDGCTSFAVLPSETTGGHLLVGQNWDWIPDVEGAVLHSREPDGFETLAFTEAGIVGGKIGLNSAGLGLAINGLLSTADDWSRLEAPFHVRCYEILRCRSVAEAATVVTGSPRACSANFLLAQSPDVVVDIEAAPNAECSTAPVQGSVVHTNHFLEPLRIGVVEPKSERRPHSYSRLTRMRELLDARRPVSVADLEACLRDHDNYPDSICRHENPEDPPEEACVTVVSAIMDLDDRSLWLSDGHPCERLYEPYSL